MVYVEEIKNKDPRKKKRIILDIQFMLSLWMMDINLIIINEYYEAEIDIHSFIV